ncbi:DoxX family protein [Halioglobus sp. HI00S01]|uniref:DoxX family protein n=1 Tax=Halioglobus sp. HI00S01 TaxID=1822214 RepID=UPI0009EF2D88|nr:DoxX family protein [Halioglobus sp. HI00S01]
MTTAEINQQLNAGISAAIPAGLTDLLARTLMAAVFILAGLSKISGYEGNLAYMASVGVPGFLLPAVIALEVLGGAALVVGFQTRLVAILLALFSIASGVLFHFDLADQMQFIMLFKNLAMAGGLLAIANARPGAFTLDRKLGA